jgi:hypothetical protein
MNTLNNLEFLLEHLRMFGESQLMETNRAIFRSKSGVYVEANSAVASWATWFIFLVIYFFFWLFGLFFLAI